MTPLDLELRRAYGLEPDRLAVAGSSINDTYRIETRARTFALRVYRAVRPWAPTDDDIGFELALPIRSPCACRTRDHEPVSTDLPTVTLWRPTGPEELALVEASGWRRWPPRLAEQPIFYPVLNEDYATTIARDWNVPSSGAGYVTRFEVRKDFLDRYDVHQVGGRTILEYWIPAGHLDEFNANIVGTIEVVAEYR